MWHIHGHKGQPHAAGAVSDTARTGPGVCAPGAAVTRNQGRVLWLCSLTWLRMMPALHKRQAHQVIYFIPWSSANHFWLFQHHTTALPIADCPSLKTAFC